MKLYHFTTPLYLRSIFEKGLWKGDRLWKASFDWGKRCVWLTTDIDPMGHGLVPEKRRLRIRLHDFALPLEAQILAGLCQEEEDKPRAVRRIRLGRRGQVGDLVHLPRRSPSDRVSRPCDWSDHQGRGTSLDASML